MPTLKSLLFRGAIVLAGLAFVSPNPFRWH